MNHLLLDSQALLWFASDDLQLSRKARSAIEDGRNELWLSIASVWELSIKLGLGKLTLKESLSELLEKQILTNRLQIMSISLEHTYAIQHLPYHHRDPFDRLIVVQTRLEKVAIISSDEVFDTYKAKRIW